MNYTTTSHFRKAARQLSDANRKRLALVLNTIEAAERLSDLTNCKEMQGKKNKGYYRIRFGDYRLGFKILDQQIVQLIDVGPRGDFYNRFP
jgi:mRNA interferase RelE/StbE